MTVIVASTWLLAASLAAQDTTNCRFDTLGHTFRDTVTIGLTPLRQASQSEDAITNHLLIAQAIQEHFQPPGAVGLPLWARTTTSAASIVARFPPPDSLHLVFPAPYGLHGYIRFRLDATGRLADSTIDVEIASPDIRDAIVAAIRGADSAFAFPPPSAALRHDGGRVRLEFVQHPNRAGRSVPLLRVVVPVIKIEEGPKMLAFPRLNYPINARQSGLGDHVVVQFVVGADGRIVPGTMDLLEAHYRVFAEEVIGAAKDARFQPAHIGGCSLPTIVRMPINFTIRH